MDHAGPRSWASFLDALKPAGELEGLLLDPQDEHLRELFRLQLFNTVSQAYWVHFLATPEFPDWTPMPSSAFINQPNPDDVYLYTPIRGDRTYRIQGTRGSTCLMTISVKEGLVGTMAPPHPLISLIDVDDLTIDAEGRFSLIISPERPAGYTGDWVKLEPKGRMIQARRRSYDWSEEDGQIAIECLDGPLLKPMPNAAQIAARMAEVPAYVERFLKTWLVYHHGLRERGAINRMEFNAFSELGGLGAKIGDKMAQDYWQCLFEIDDGEALILETEIPGKVRYWNVQLNDPIFNAIDYWNRLGGLNGSQAKLSSDGRFRAVLALEDPGVPNWLDPAGFKLGTIIGRWFEADGRPLPTVTRVKASEVRKHLPADTPTVTAAEREAEIRERRRAYQFRRRW